MATAHKHLSLLICALVLHKPCCRMRYLRPFKRDQCGKGGGGSVCRYMFCLHNHSDGALHNRLAAYELAPDGTKKHDGRGQQSSSARRPAYVPIWSSNRNHEYDCGELQKRSGNTADGLYRALRGVVTQKKRDIHRVKWSTSVSFKCHITYLKSNFEILYTVSLMRSCWIRVLIS